MYVSGLYMLSTLVSIILLDEALDDEKIEVSLTTLVILRLEILVLFSETT